MTDPEPLLTGTVTGLYRNFRLGDPEAFTELWGHFRTRLLGLARQTLAGRLQPVTDAEDALQSAFVSFWQRSERGDFGDELDREDLWNLLGLITVRKALKHQRRQGAQKRGGGIAGHAVPLEDIAAADDSPDFAITCEELLEKLDPDLKVFAVLRMMGAKNREVAEQLGCTERKVERKLNLIRATWETEIAEWSA
jgi:RNA polymerase sigma factor (sigma-70 family)